ncbi:hypothetical protein P9112_003457 [Eukaryota sp. TZLM1-RC]
MSDVLYINVGQAGCSIGNTVLQSVHSHHSSPFFKDNSPHALFCDSEPRVISSRSSQWNSPSFFAKVGASTNWGRGFTQSSLIESICDGIRKKSESMDWLGSICWTSSITGGSGGGLFCGILTNDDVVHCPNHVLVSPVSVNNTIPLHSFCSSLSIYNCFDYLDSFLFFDNDRLFNFNSRKAKRVSLKQTKTIDQVNIRISDFIKNVLSPTGSGNDVTCSKFPLTSSEIFQRFGPFLDCFSVSSRDSTATLIDDQYKQLTEALVCELVRGVETNAMVICPQRVHSIVSAQLGRLPTLSSTFYGTKYTENNISLMGSFGIAPSTLLRHAIRARRSVMSGAYVHYLEQYDVEMSTIRHACSFVEGVVEREGLTVSYSDSYN